MPTFAVAKGGHSVNPKSVNMTGSKPQPSAAFQTIFVSLLTDQDPNQVD